MTNEKLTNEEMIFETTFKLKFADEKIKSVVTSDLNLIDDEVEKIDAILIKSLFRTMGEHVGMNEKGMKMLEIMASQITASHNKD